MIDTSTTSTTNAPSACFQYVFARIGSTVAPRSRASSDPAPADRAEEVGDEPACAPPYVDAGALRAPPLDVAALDGAGGSGDSVSVTAAAGAAASSSAGGSGEPTLSCRQST